RATPANVGLVKQGRRMAGNWLLPDCTPYSTYSNASSGEGLFSLRNQNQNEEIFRDIFLCWPINGPALMFFMIRPFLVFLPFTTWLKQLSCSLFSVPATSIPLAVEIIGTAFRTGFQ